MSTETITAPPAALVRALAEVSAGRVTCDDRGWMLAGFPVMPNEVLLAALKYAAVEELLVRVGYAGVALSDGGKRALRAQR